MLRYKTLLLDEKAIERAIRRIAHEIIERNKGLEQMILVGIHTRGVPLAQRLARDLESIRTDIRRVDKGKTAFNADDKTIVLVDDVLFTGRTVRSALNAVMEAGRPKFIELAVLIDRGHRELPIRADYVGKNVPTALREAVSVQLEETDEKNQVVLCEEVPR